MARQRITQSESQAPYPIAFTVGPDGVLAVNASSTHESRQEIASCLLDVVNDLAIEHFDDSRVDEQRGYAIAYLTSIAKGLLDSMDFKEQEEEVA